MDGLLQQQIEQIQKQSIQGVETNAANAIMSGGINQQFFEQVETQGNQSQQFQPIQQSRESLQTLQAQEFGQVQQLQETQQLSTANKLLEEQSTITQIGTLSRENESVSADSGSKFRSKSRRSEGKLSKQRRQSEKSKVSIRVSEYDEMNKVRENLIEGKAVAREMDFIKSCQAQLKNLQTTGNIDNTRIDQADKELSGAVGMLDGIDRYSKKPMPLQDKNFLDASITFLQSMMGAAYTHLAAAEEKLSEASKEAGSGEPQTEELIEALHNEKQNFGESRVKIYDEALSSFDKQENVRWSEIMSRCIGEKVVDLSNEQTGKNGGAMSDVTTYEQSGTRKFFKGDEKILTNEEIFEKAYKIVPGEDTKGLLKLLSDNEALRVSLRVSLGKVDYKYDGNKYLLENAMVLLPKELLDQCSIDSLIKISPALKRMYAAGTTRKNMNMIGSGEGQEMTPRNIATERMAQLLGCGDIVVHSERTSIVTKEGGEKKGFTMDGAKGSDITELGDKMPGLHKDVYSASFVQKLMKLQILDNIIGQNDRHMNNLIADCEKSKGKYVFTSVQGIDNDICFGLKYNLTGMRGKALGVLDKEQKYNLPYIDKDIYSAIRALSPDIIKSNLAGILDNEHIGAAVERFNTIKAGIEAAVKDKQEIVIEGEKWGDANVQKSLKGSRYINGTDTPDDIAPNLSPMEQKTAMRAQQTQNYFARYTEARAAFC